MSHNIFQEHDNYREIKFDRLLIGNSVVKTNEPRYFNDHEGFSYYIGAMWLRPVNSNSEDDKQAIIVNPKIGNIDFMAMFLACLKHPRSAENFDQIYHIYFNETSIFHQDNPLAKELDPLVLAHFIYCLEPLIKKGLKHNFILHEDNLSTIKGKLLFSQHLKQNIFKNRNHKAYCRFSQYDINCVENRILKKALSIAKKNMQTQHKDLVIKLNNCLSVFQGVSDELSLWELNHIRINPIYREYKPAIEIAKLVIKLERFNSGQSKETPPFWIDMPLLFERYVYSLMLDDPTNWKNIIYQKRTRRGVPDFLLQKEQIIADTKYRYYKGGITLDHARQISGYARTYSIRDEFKLSRDDISVVSCLIIYPEKNKDLTADKNKWNKSNKYTEFYKIGVRLPRKK